jgi:sec-independent protein translocase protein TatA
MLGSIGMPELLVILLIVVVLFGARRLPELGKSLGQGIRSFRDSMSAREADADSQPDKPAASDKK